MMKRCFVLALCVGLLTFSIACGSGSSNTQPPPPPSDPDQRADALIAQMTIDEKIHMVHGGAALDWWAHPLPRGAGGYISGIPRLNIPDLYFADGSAGLSASAGPATALPSAIAGAASWDLDLAAKYGQVIGAETRAYGINVNLGGNVNNTGREPRDGRTFETKGEDPILAGKINAAHIKGIRDQYVLAGLKHYALNDQETGRTTLDVGLDERSARESDLLAFEISLKDSGVQSVMCSYNLLNSAHACENSFLLNTVLKQDWAFPGFVMSDWDATHSTVNAAVNGLDQEQPENIYFDASLKQAVQNGQVPQSRLDNMVHRILRAMIVDGLFDHPMSIRPIDAGADAAIAQQAEEQGAVLLKNTGILPLGTNLASIAVIGSHADLGILSGGGSAQVQPVGGSVMFNGQPYEALPCPPCWSRVIWDPSPPLAAIQAKVPGTTVQFDDGTDISSAVALASSSKVAIVFVSQWESEGMDVPTLNFTDVIHSTPIDQDALVSAVAAANPQTIVVMENGGPKTLPWLANVAAVLEAWYPGQSGGPAIANLLFGDANPSGKLPMTFPVSVNDLPRPIIAVPPVDGITTFPVDYSIEGFNVGYKWYDSQEITPLFPFGFGLSYTTFAVANPQLSATSSGSSSTLQVTFDIQNTGTRAGAEVEQVYLQLPDTTGESRRLVGWQKISLTPGQQQSGSIQVSASDSSHPLSYWDVNSHAWVVASGTYTVYLGNSSRNMVSLGTFEVP